jgi:hypothetical protein
MENLHQRPVSLYTQTCTHSAPVPPLLLTRFQILRTPSTYPRKAHAYAGFNTSRSLTPTVRPGALLVGRFVIRETGRA